MELASPAYSNAGNDDTVNALTINDLPDVPLGMIFKHFLPASNPADVKFPENEVLKLRFLLGKLTAVCKTWYYFINNNRALGAGFDVLKARKFARVVWSAQFSDVFGRHDNIPTLLRKMLHLTHPFVDELAEELNLPMESFWLFSVNGGGFPRVSAYRRELRSSYFSFTQYTRLSFCDDLDETVAMKSVYGAPRNKHGMLVSLSLLAHFYAVSDFKIDMERLRMCILGEGEHRIQANRAVFLDAFERIRVVNDLHFVDYKLSYYKDNIMVVNDIKNPYVQSLTIDHRGINYSNIPDALPALNVKGFPALKHLHLKGLHLSDISSLAEIPNKFTLILENNYYVNWRNPLDCLKDSNLVALGIDHYIQPIGLSDFKNIKGFIWKFAPSLGHMRPFPVNKLLPLTNVRHVRLLFPNCNPWHLRLVLGADGFAQSLKSLENLQHLEKLDVVFEDNKTPISLIQNMEKLCSINPKLGCVTNIISANGISRDKFRVEFKCMRHFVRKFTDVENSNHGAALQACSGVCWSCARRHPEN